MRWRRFVLGLAVGLWCLPSAAPAILMEADGVRIGGYFIRDDGQKLTIPRPHCGRQGKSQRI